MVQSAAMQIKEPWIDPIKYKMEDVLDEREFHLVYLMANDDDTFYLVTPDELVDAHSTSSTSKHTTNMIAVSVEKSDVEGVTHQGKIQTKSLPRVKIAIDTVFLNAASIDEKIKEAYGYFEFV